MRYGLRILVLISCSGSVVVSSPNYASDFGTNGLILMPTSRMADDGNLKATVRRSDVADIYNISYQATPWLEATFRYSIFNPRDFKFSSDVLRDRSYEAKARVFKERAWLPAVAVGVRDILGTGVWEGEYIVASKGLGSFDVSAGLGWGRLASRNPVANPLSIFDSAFESRPSVRESGGKFGGESRSGSYFRGATSWFGGLRYSFKKLPVEALVEYNSDNYAREIELNTLASSSPFNVGIEWSMTDNTAFATSWLHGSSLGFRITSSLDTKTTPKRKSGMSFYSASEPKSLSGTPKNLNMDAWYDRLLYDAERSGLRLNKAGVDRGRAAVFLEIENAQFALTADAVHKVLSVAEVNLPRDIETVEILLREEGHSAPTVRYQRHKGARGDTKTPSLNHSDHFRAQKIDILPVREIEVPSNITIYQYPFINLGADLSTRMQLMDPDAPFSKQVYAKFSARVSIAPGVNLWGVYGQDIYNDFTVDRLSDSRMQRVRSDVNYYLTEGESGLDQLFLEYRKSPRRTIHYRTYAGILEGMYAGIGGELLYEPFGERWAIGATVNRLKQRGFKKNFELRDYSTVTGFVSMYYASIWYNLDFAIHAGRYLAKDKGATLEARRTFDNGFSIGGFFTRTNVPAELFGEGSFDKGLYFKIPFNGIIPGNSKSSYATIVRPLERDGGRRLEDFSGSLWFARRNVRFDALANNVDRMLP